MRCPGCQHDNPDGVRFCGACGAALDRPCPACGTPCPPANRFCHQCGAAVAAPGPAAAAFVSPAAYTPRHLAEKILTSRSALEGERKRVTVLFCDIADSTGLAQRLGPDAMHALLDEFFQLALAEVHRYEGTVNQFLGDGFMALFGAPIAHEDDARRAVRAALAIRRGLGRRQAALATDSGAELAVRMGLNTGLVVVGSIGDNLRMDYTAIGDTTNLAARLQGLAPPGAIYISEASYRAVRDVIDCEPQGRLTVKGKAEPVPVFAVTGPTAGPAGPPAERARPPRPPLVGRAAELATLRGCLDRLGAGHGGVVAIQGEAGIGKSRLVAEARSMASERGIRWLEGRSLSAGDTPSYAPFLEILRAHFGLRVEYLDPGAMGRQILLAASRLVERMAAGRPLALVFEDLHWADLSSIELLEHLLPKTEVAPLLLCLVSRPDPETPAARLLSTAARRHGDRFAEVALAPLPPDETGALAEALLAGARLGRDFGDLLIQRSDGNPLFLEEIIRSLVDMQVLARGPGQGWRLTRPVQDIAIPDTIQGLITARLDRLEESPKRTLKLAAVIGPVFLHRVLAAVVGDEQRLGRDLAVLARADLIRERRREPELEYAFIHAFVQEVADESIVLPQRRELHRAVATALEALYPNRLEELSGVLAHHYAEAEVWERAEHYLVTAGDQASRIAADAEALAHYRKAVEAYGRSQGKRWDPLQRAALERKMGEAFFRRGEHGRAEEYLQRALTLLGSTPLPPSRWGIRAAIAKQLAVQAWHRLWPRPAGRPGPAPLDPAAKERDRIYEAMGWIDYFGDQERFMLDALLGLNDAERHGLEASVALGLSGVGIMCDALQLRRLARSYMRRATALAGQLQHPVALGYAYVGMAQCEQNEPGGFPKALDWLERSADAFSKAGHVRGWGLATWQRAYLIARGGDFPGALDLLGEVARIARDAGDRQMWGWALYDLGLVTLCGSGPADAVPLLRQSVELLSAVPDYLSVAIAESYLAQCYLRQGRVDEALFVIEDANRIIDERGFGRSAYPARIARAEACLTVAEAAAGPAHRQTLRRAAAASRAALKLAAGLRDARPEAWRLRGTLEWLRRRPSGAWRWWRRSLAAAQELGAPYETARTHLEIGRLSGDAEHLERAVAGFILVGASWDLDRTRGLRAAAGGVISTEGA